MKAGTDPLAMLTNPKKKKPAPKPQPTQQTNTQNGSNTKLPTLNDAITEQKQMYYSEEKIAFLRKFYHDEEFIKANAKMLPSENLEIYEEASYNSEDPFSRGLLILTKFRIIYKFQDPQQLKKLKLSDNYFSIPLFYIKNVTKKQNNDKYTIEMVLKDSRNLRFIIYNKNNVKFYGDLTEAIFPKDPKQLFTYSFDYLRYLFHFRNFYNGWDVYDIEKEYQRQGINKEDQSLQIRYTYINENFELCQTYPPILVVPVKSTDTILKEAADHRTKNRLPVLTYYYNKHGCTSSLWRSSQSKAGVTNKKSEGDVKHMENIIALNQKIYIYDARPYFNALANRAKGGGYENVEHYTNAILDFCKIDNIHVARKSLENVYSLSLSKDLKINDKIWSNLDSSNWFVFIQKVMKYSLEIATKLSENKSVLIHCSDGWDRTAQLSATSQLLIDPYYRTIKGFAVLIEKDWLSFGHQFGLRNGIYLTEQKEDQRSPIFLQFLDCVHQVLNQFPQCFEFNNELILFLAVSSTTNQYGTFMFNNENERRFYDANIKTTSVWSDVFMNIDKYRNPFYDPENITEFIQPNYATYSFVFWAEFFAMNSSSMQSEPIYLNNDMKENYKTQQEFYVKMKMKDKENIQQLENDMNTMNECLSDILQATKGTEVFETFDEYTQNYFKYLDSQNSIKQTI